MRSHLIGGAALALALAASAAGAQDVGIPVGSRAPVAALQTLDGKPATLAQFVGKTPLLLEFWAAWCENCHALEPHLLAMQKKYASRVKFLGVAVSFNQSVNRARLYKEKHRLPYEIWYDGKGDAGAAYDAPGTSYVVVIDKGGKVVYTGIGGDQKLETAIRKAM